MEDWQGQMAINGESRYVRNVEQSGRSRGVEESRSRGVEE